MIEFFPHLWLLRTGFLCVVGFNALAVFELLWDGQAFGTANRFWRTACLVGRMVIVL